MKTRNWLQAPRMNSSSEIQTARVSFDPVHDGMVKVEFPRHVGHYKNLAYAMQDVNLFNCTPVYDDWQLEAEATVRRMQNGPEWYKSGR